MQAGYHPSCGSRGRWKEVAHYWKRHLKVHQYLGISTSVILGSNTSHHLTYPDAIPVGERRYYDSSAALH